jgi:hypothetical protein
MRISDREVIGLLVGRYRTSAAASAALGLPNYTIANWRKKGVPRSWRRTIWQMCRDRGLRFSEEWINHPAERAAIRKAIRLLARTTDNEGADDGEAGPKKEQDERRAHQRRAAAGRNIPAAPR